MIENLLLRVYENVKAQGIAPSDEAKLGPALSTALREHIEKMTQMDTEAQKDLEVELKEQAKHITSDDLKEGWDSKVYSAILLYYLTSV